MYRLRYYISEFYSKLKLILIVFLSKYCFLYRKFFPIWKVVPLVWMNEYTECSREIIKKRATSIAYEPNFINYKPSRKTVDLYNVYCYSFKDARVSPISSSIILNDNLVLIDKAVGDKQEKYDYAAGHIVKKYINSAVIRLRKHETIEKGIFLCGNGSSNYYHWMIEIVSKSQFKEKLAKTYNTFPYLVSEYVASIPQFMEIFNIFFGFSKIIPLNKKKSYIVNELIYLTNLNSLPFNLSGNSKFDYSYISIDKTSIFYIREIGLKAALHKKEKGLYDQKYPERIFLYRKNKIRNYNQDEVFEFLSTFGFKKVSFEDFSFIEQVKIIQNSKIIVGPTGAAWTNLIFCKAGTKGLCWMAEESRGFSAYSTIAMMVGVDLRYIGYRAGVNSTGALYYKDYTVDINAIKEGLQHIGL